MTTSYDPVLQIQNRAYVWKEKGQNGGVIRRLLFDRKTWVQAPVLARIRPAESENLNLCSWQWILTSTVKKKKATSPCITKDIKYW